ncbi:DUF4179 domain-containing protein [Caldalkalibacillus salinus]|uniref:DUF4179 domain-containing protein n=1 Tax=Caldalkalibacillus salinus TaxID=2803787 RepID=UPI001920C15A|nr:DUF4179 domain-containing protein [Caldalkalibacillus salinus]
MDDFKNVTDRLQEDSKTPQLPDQLDCYIAKGMTKARTHKGRITKRRWFATAIACMLIMAMVTSVRVSPAFAQFISQLPGGQTIVDLVHYDKGLQDALDHDYAIPVGVSDEHFGLRLTIEGMTIDESRIVLFYSVTNKRDFETVTLSALSFGDTLKKYSLGLGTTHDFTEENTVYGKVDIHLSEQAELPDVLAVEAKLRAENEARYVDTSDVSWRMAIPIDRASFEGLQEHFELDKTVEFAGQKVTFKEVTIYPTRTLLRVTYDEENEYQIFSLEGLSMTNEKGQRWEMTSEGVTGTQYSDDDRTYHLDSSFFHESEHLYLEVPRVRALPKSETEMIIDTHKDEIVKAPRGLNLEVTSEDLSGVKWYEFEVPLDPTFDRTDITYQYIDRSVKNKMGEEVAYVNAISGGYNDGEGQSFGIKKPNTAEEHIVLKIIDYPNRLHGDVQIQIK